MSLAGLLLATALLQGNASAALLWPDVSSNQILRYARTDRVMAPFNHTIEGAITVKISAADTSQIDWTETLLHRESGRSQADPPFQLLSGGAMTEGGGAADARIRPFYNPALLGSLPATLRAGLSWTMRFTDLNNQFAAPGTATIHVSRVDTAARRVEFTIDFDGSSNRQLTNPMAAGVVSMDIHKRAHATAVFTNGILSSWHESGTLLERTAGSPAHSVNYDVTDILLR